MPTPAPRVTAAEHLRQDHLAFRDRFVDICGRARSGDWRDLDDVWGGFAASLRDHLAFEERELFGAYAERDADSRILVDRLRAEHDEIRRTLDELGIQIQLKSIRATTIDAFVEVMQRHAAIENAHLYPWAESRGTP